METSATVARQSIGVLRFHLPSILAALPSAFLALLRRQPSPAFARGDGGAAFLVGVEIGQGFDGRPGREPAACRANVPALRRFLVAAEFWFVDFLGLLPGEVGVEFAHLDFRLLNLSRIIFVSWSGINL